MLDSKECAQQRKCRPHPCWAAFSPKRTSVLVGYTSARGSYRGTATGHVMLARLRPPGQSCAWESRCFFLNLKVGVFQAVSKTAYYGALRDTWHCTVQEQIAMFLTTVGHHKKNSDISFHFTRSGETVSRYFNQVLYAIGQLGPEMLRHRSLDIPSKIVGNPRFDPYFKVWPFTILYQNSLLIIY